MTMVGVALMGSSMAYTLPAMVTWAVFGVWSSPVEPSPPPE